ncbi:MAG: ATP-binding protein [Oscillospiraceae bacterium]
MKICEEMIPPLHVFQELYEENPLFARGLRWLDASHDEATRFKGYANVSSELLMTGQTLGDYLTDMVLYSKSPLFAKIVKEPTEQRKKALAYDLGLLKGIVKDFTSAALKKTLTEKYGAVGAALPEFESGKFTLTAERLIKRAQKNGTGDFAKHQAFTYRDRGLVPVKTIDPIRLTDLKNYETQRNQVVENTITFLNGLPAQNVLLYGDRGCGKSSTIKAILNEYEELRMVELPKSEIDGLPMLFDLLKDVPLHFIVTIDDLSFSENDERFGVLKATLDGSLAARPDNILIYATTNRRKLIKETNGDRSVDEIGRSDAVDESMSLADRFGLFVTFTQPNREVFFDIVRKLAEDAGIEMEDSDLIAAAERFALKRGGRSPRIARQFTDWLGSRIELGLDF